MESVRPDDVTNESHSGEQRAMHREESVQPTVVGAAIFTAKTKLFQLKRALEDAKSSDLRRHKKATEYTENEIIAESITTIWTETDPHERKMQLGKAQNLRLSAHALNGVEIPAHAIFSFWKHVGPATAGKKYVPGRELRQGCIVPTVGGGLCQLSNALYDAALKAGFEIVERHGHSEVIPGSLAEQNRDATIFWNYVDLRFRSENPFHIEAILDSESLIVRFRGTRPAPKKLLQIVHADPVSEEHSSSDHHGPNSCFSCGVADCFRNVAVVQTKIDSRTAYLVDEYWPEYDAYIQKDRKETDLIFMPVRGDKMGKENYNWNVAGFYKVKTAPLATIARSRESRKLARQGAERQRALQRHQSELAKTYASKLKFDVTHLVVSQGLLPFLWREGVLGGRTFDVIMTQLPMQKLHERLNYAHMLHMDSPTLADYRADDEVLKAETEALRAARKIITPHAEIASIFPGKNELLAWHIPAASNEALRSSTLGPPASLRASDFPESTDGSDNAKNRFSRILFPASTLGRKGAYELREAARHLKFTVVLGGPQLEDPTFWTGITTDAADEADMFENVSAVVLPAFVEHKPRRLLKAVSMGLPVIATSACGLHNIPGVITVPLGDVQALISALTPVFFLNESINFIRTR